MARLEYRRCEAMDQTLIVAVKACYKDRGIGDQAMVDRIVTWWEDDAKQSIPLRLSKSTYNNLRLQSKVPASEMTARAIYGFLAEGPLDFRYISAAGLSGAIKDERDQLASALLGWTLNGAPMRYSALSGLEGNYEMYRPSWKTGKRASPISHVIRSHVTIRRHGIAFWLYEHQFFETGPHKVDESDEGILMPFAMSIMCLSQSTDHACVKLYSFHDCDPAPSEHISTTIIKGNVMAVSNKGPHWSGPVYLTRASGSRKPKDHLSVGTFLAESHEHEAILAFLNDPQASDDHKL